MQVAEGGVLKYKTVPQMPDISFSAVGFGCWAMGGSDVWNGSTDASSVRTIHAAIDAGITFFDVAPVYGFGHAEEILGQALPGHRDQVIVASKCGLLWDDKGVTRNDLTPASIRWEIDQSLSRLNTDHLDIYQIHWPDPATPIEDSMGALLDLQTAGKIHHIGVSNFSVARTLEAAAVAPVVSHQGLYNMLEHNPTSYHGIPLEYRTADEILPMVTQRGMAFFPYSPLFQGLLTDAFRASSNFDANDVRSANPKLNGALFDTYFGIASQLRAFAQDIGHPLNQVAINWQVSQSAVTSVIAGAQTPDQVTQNAQAADWELTADMTTRINEILAPFQESGLI